MNCENKKWFQNYYILIPCCWPQCFSAQRCLKTASTWEKFSVLFSLWGQIPGLISTFLFLRRLISSFSLTVTLKVFLLCLLRHTQLSVSFSLSSLPLFSLVGSVSLPRDSRVLCSRYRPIDFWREGIYCGHDSPCMNLVIPLLSLPSFQWRREPINHRHFFYHPHFRHVSNQIHRRG